MERATSYATIASSHNNSPPEGLSRDASFLVAERAYSQDMGGPSRGPGKGAVAGGGPAGLLQTVSSAQLGGMGEDKDRHSKSRFAQVGCAGLGCRCCWGRDGRAAGVAVGEQCGMWGKGRQ